MPMMQRSPVLQALPSSHAVVSGWFWKRQPMPASQESAVQGLLSSQVSVLIAVQTPLTQRSPSVQAFESLHATLESGFAVQPVDGLQESAVHGLPSSHETELP